MHKCKCVTEKGKRCSREGQKKYEGYCWQHHKKCKKSDKKTKSKKIKTASKNRLKDNQKRLKTVSKSVVIKSPAKLPNLPDDVTRAIWLNLSSKDVIKACTANKKDSKRICDSAFWRSKIKQDFQKNTGHTLTDYKILANYWVGPYKVLVPNSITSIVAKDGRNTRYKNGSETEMAVQPITKEKYLATYATKSGKKYYYKEI